MATKLQNKYRRIKKRIDGIDTTSGKGQNWYQESREVAQAVYGEDYELFVKCLAATSPNCTVSANVTIAGKAYVQIKSTGTVNRDSFMDTHYKGLIKVINGHLPNGPKVSRFARNLLGDESCVVVDMWMMRAAGIKNRKSPTSFEYKSIEKIIQLKAKRNDRTPAQEQAAIWCEIRGTSDSFATHMRQLRLF